MATGELTQRRVELCYEPILMRSRAYLTLKIAWWLQAMAEGDMSERARRRAAKRTRDADVRPERDVCMDDEGRRPPRLKPSRYPRRAACPTVGARRRWAEWPNVKAVYTLGKSYHDNPFCTVSPIGGEGARSTSLMPQLTFHL